ncbi:DUF6950 family protein [Vibrio alginolyticus]|uniref:DUF6950 family protein n=1 Tax=Vibrio alginolyticus TaxID=663 RepID=UPI00211A08FD|nr:hypothetical protein [Vibrio alginolyticus]MCQ9070508.1 hypothetical protein [Vibrio alginolyticus]
MFEKAAEVIEDYKDEEHVRGTRDCNLLVLKLFDEENYKKMKGHYTTIRGGVRVSKRVYGVRSMYEYLQKNESFVEVPKGFERPLDVIAFRESHNIYISLGTKWFGVTEGEYFGFVSPEAYSQEDYVIYRKENS